MSMQVGELVWKITGDNSGLNKSFKDSEKKAKGFSGVMKTVGAGIAGVFATAAAAVGVYLKSTVKAASDAKEVGNKFGVVFRGITSEANKMAQSLADSYGMSITESKKLLSNTGDLLTGFGYSREAALDMSMNVQQLAADLASFNNVQTDFASEALTKGLFGETEQMKSLGIVVNQNAAEFKELVKRKQVDEGMTLQQAKAMAIYETAVSQSQNALGDFARSADSWANIQKRVNARIADTNASIGQKLLPGLESVGIAFLGASKDGSIFQSALSGIATTISEVLIGFSGLIAKIQQWNAESAQEDILERQRNVTKEIKATNAALLQTGLTQAQIDKRGAGTFITEEQRLNLVKLNALYREQEGLIDSNKKASQDQEDIAATLNALNQKKNDLLNGTIEAREEEKRQQKDLINGQNNYNKSVKDTRSEFQKLAEEVKKVSDAYASGLSQVEGLFSSISNLQSAVAERRASELDAAMQRELEAAGLLEDSKEEQLLNEIARAEKAGDADTVLEKKKALERLKIEQKYAKKKAQLEHQAAMASWEMQMAMAIATLPIMVMNAFSSGAAIPMIGAVMGPAYAALALAAGVVQIAAVAAAKPKAPSFQTGGIVPGTSMAGDSMAAQVNSGEMILNGAQQRRLFDIADGRGGSGGGNISIHIGENLIYENLYEATKNGDLLIDTRAVVTA